MQHLHTKLISQRVITKLVRQLSVLSSLRSLEEDDMSYRQRGGAGGYCRGRGGPNRGGGRGRGGRGGRGRGGRGKDGGGTGAGGGGGGHPPGLSGREIGMFYARGSKRKKEEREKTSVCLFVVL